MSVRRHCDSRSTAAGTSCVEPDRRAPPGGRCAAQCQRADPLAYLLTPLNTIGSVHFYSEPALMSSSHPFGASVVWTLTFCQPLHTTNHGHSASLIVLTLLPRPTVYRPVSCTTAESNQSRIPERATDRVFLAFSRHPLFPTPPLNSTLRSEMIPPTFVGGTSTIVIKERGRSK